MCVSNLGSHKIWREISFHLDQKFSIIWQSILYTSYIEREREGANKSLVNYTINVIGNVLEHLSDYLI